MYVEAACHPNQENQEDYRVYIGATLPRLFQTLVPSHSDEGIGVHLEPRCHP